MGTKNTPGNWDCYANAAPDEPMFVLLGRDPTAAVTLLFWVGARTNDAVVAGSHTPEDVAQWAEALQCAQAMWRDACARGKRARCMVALEMMCKLGGASPVDLLKVLDGGDAELRDVLASTLPH